MPIPCASRPHRQPPERLTAHGIQQIGRLPHSFPRLRFPSGIRCGFSAARYVVEAIHCLGRARQPGAVAHEGDEVCRRRRSLTLAVRCCCARCTHILAVGAPCHSSHGFHCAQGPPHLRTEPRASASGSRTASSAFQPAIEPLERFILHFTVELVRTGIELHAIAIGGAGLLIHVS
jgi:hypothetical protein